MTPAFSQKLAAEFFGTFALVFAGTGAIVVNDISDGAVTHVGIALTFGLVVTAMIYAVGNVSGAHLNPAVTIGLWRAQLFSSREIPGYIVAQLAGAFSASLLLKLAFTSHATLGATLPRGGDVMTSFVLEVVLSFLLMFVILNLAHGDVQTKALAGIAIGAVVGLEAMFAGPICGASMNPARSIAPAIASGQIQHLWAYFAAPVLGAILAVPGCRSVQGPECCSSPNGCS